jgi:hypothetical protein
VRLWILAAAFVALVACGRESLLFGTTGASSGGSGGTGGAPTGGGGDRPPAHASSIDLLLVIDNSRSMADKQEILGLAVPELVRQLANPLCIGEDGLPVAQQPASADDPCPSGKRQFEPVDDIHIGVTTSSLGGHGADSCGGSLDPSENDGGHLVTRGPGGSVPTYDDLGFLAWDPDQAMTPPGTANQASLESNFKALVVGAGQVGCGYEAQHEAWYRFLVDPDPYETIVAEGNEAVLVGTDQALLVQRAAFLRPNSLLAIVVLSDENDCSIRDGSQYFFAAQIYQPGTNTPYHLPKPRAACATDPNDPCCRSCGQAPGDGCDTSADDCSGSLPAIDDHVNLRCYDQKRRFGIDFLQPIDRYVDGLREPTVSDRHGNVVQNPLFTDLDPTDDVGGSRDERLVFLLGLVGVPWQDIARRNAAGQPDLQSGIDADGKAIGGFQSAGEMLANDTWSLVVGNPPRYHAESGALPTDPLMIESITPRSGVHPITGEPVAPPGSSQWANGINGHEYTVSQKDDLQYACIFPLIQPRNCAMTPVGCDCNDPGDDPLCQGRDDQFGFIQYRAKAYPGIRHLEILRGAGPQGVVGSICPAQITNSQTVDFGYVPALRALVEAVEPVLAEP